MFGLFILSVPLFIPLLHKLLYTHYYWLSKAEGNLDETNNKEQEEEEQVDHMSNLWSELDPNLLGEILGRLCLADQIRFHVVCKNWLHTHPITAIRKPLLWYLSFDRSLLELQLHDPSSPDQASVQKISLPKLGIPSPSSYKGVAADLNHNWLIIWTLKRRLFFRDRQYFFLYSPFTKKAITLPKFDFPCPLKYFVSTSSTQPHSPDCIFFLLDTCNAHKVTIISYCNGDKEWTAKEFKTVANFKPCFCEPVYLRGILYIVSPYGQLASYNFLDGEFKFECLFIDELFRLNIRSLKGYYYRVFKLNGELMIIHFVPFKKKNFTLPGKPCISRYNWSNKDWILTSNLGDKSLFFCEKNNQVAIITKDDMKYSGVLSNKIYHFFDGGCLIYSIQDGELIEFKSINSNLMEEGGSDLPEYKYKGGSVFAGATKAMYWLEPPRICSENSHGRLLNNLLY